jgi:hypothetical protein
MDWTAVHLLLPLLPVASAMLRLNASCHLLRHCILVRPGTFAAMALQSLPPCVCTASFYLLSSTAIHLPLRPVARAMLGFKVLCHLSQHRPGTRAEIAPQSLPSLHLYRMYCLLFLLPINPNVCSSGRCWVPRNDTICYYTFFAFAFDLEEAWYCSPIPVARLTPLRLVGIRHCTSQLCVFS